MKFKVYEVKATRLEEKDDYEQSFLYVEYEDAVAKFKELVETKNQAESMAGQCEKILSDAGDKISEEDKAAVRAEAEALKATISSDDVDTIKAGIEKFQKKFYEVSEKLYKAAQEAAQAQQGGAAGEGYTEANYTDAE